MSTSESDDPSITTHLSEKGQEFGEKCGVAAVWTRSLSAPNLVRKASIALQHRGQESAGIAVYSEPKGFRKRFKVFGSNGYIKVHIGMGMIARVLTDDIIKSLGPSHIAIAHNRYSTTGGSSLMNAHPISAKSKNYKIAVAHNGNVPDTTWLKQNVKNHPSADSDTALIAALLVEKRRNYKSWEETFINELPKVSGAFSLTVMTEDGKVYGIRDPWGIRPLCIGKLESGFIIASESVALDAVGAEFIRDIKPGEIITISNDGELTSYFFGEPKREQLCLFEHIYFSRPDSFINSKRIKMLREESGRKVGKRLKKKGIKPDLVIPIFNSGYFAARGAASELGVPLVDAVVTSSYFGRTFINPGQEMRVNAVYGKHSIIPDEIIGKKVVFVDDSAVRFNTSAKLAQGLKDAGASKVYAAFASPPVVNQCDLGIDMRSKSELPASKYEDQGLDKIESEMAKLIKVNGVTYLSLKETAEAMEGKVRDFYTYPFGGPHPIRGAQEVFQKRDKALSGRPKLLIYYHKKTPAAESLVQKIESGEINIDLKRTVTSLKQLNQAIDAAMPDMILILDPSVQITKQFLDKCKKMEILVLRFMPHLADIDSGKIVRTSRGGVPVIHGTDSPRIYFKKNMPVSGVSIQQVLSKQVNFSPLMKEEIRRMSSDTFESWMQKFSEAEKRVTEAAVKRAAHVLSYNIKTSGGEYPW
jgi:amidophosphoribosyltransferase